MSFSFSLYIHKLYKPLPSTRSDGQGNIFDLDDTLVDTSKLAEIARKNAIENMIRHGLPVDFETAYSELIELIKEYGSNFPYHFDYL